MKIIKLKPTEAETVERAFYEADSHERLMAVLCRNLNGNANSETKEVLMHYAELCRESQMKLKLAQDMVLAHYSGIGEAGKMFRFDIVRGEVQFPDD